MKRVQLVENATTEFKRQYTVDINNGIVAIANTAGGIIYIGIANDGSIVGVTDRDDTILCVTNMVGNAIRPAVILFVAPSFETMQDKNIIKFTMLPEIVIPPKKNLKVQREYDQYLYRLHHLVENTFLMLKCWRGIATKYTKHSDSFLAAVQIRCLLLGSML